MGSKTCRRRPRDAARIDASEHRLELDAERMTEIARPKRRHRSRKYSAEPLAVVPPVEDLGPCMLALTPKQRAFVMELRAGPAGYGSEVRAARAARYGTPTSSDGSMKVMAHNV